MTDRAQHHDLVAEYVLGTLNEEERSAVEKLRATDDGFNREIEAWERRLEPLHAAMRGAAPSEGLFSKIEQRVSREATLAQRPPAARKQSWRGLALVASIVAVLFVSVSLQDKPIWGPSPSSRLVAVLQKEPSSPLFAVSLNSAARTLTVRALDGTPPAEKSYELWLIADGDPEPHALGVLPLVNTKEMPLGPNDPGVVGRGTLAISVEPLGGSPTGKVTGPVILTAKFVPATI